MSKHTQGKWEIVRDSSGALSVEVATGRGTSYQIAREVGGQRRQDSDGNWTDASEVESNARLIAAAPDLLAACKAAEDLHRIGLFCAAPGQISQANEIRRAAIAKAEGGQDEQ